MFSVEKDVTSAFLFFALASGFVSFFFHIHSQLPGRVWRRPPCSTRECDLSMLHKGWAVAEISSSRAPCLFSCIWSSQPYPSQACFSRDRKQSQRSDGVWGIKWQFMVRRQHESNLLVVLLLIQPGVSSRCDGTFLTRVQLYIHQDLQVLLYKADF